MADFNYVATGGARILGCGGYEYSLFYTTEFAIRDVVYEVQKAKSGKIASIAIKDIILPPVGDIIYVDTYNFLWAEDELCDLTTAQQYIQEYLENYDMTYQSYAEKC